MGQTPGSSPFMPNFHYGMSGCAEPAQNDLAQSSRSISSLKPMGSCAHTELPLLLHYTHMLLMHRAEWPSALIHCRHQQTPGPDQHECLSCMSGRHGVCQASWRGSRQRSGLRPATQSCQFLQDCQLVGDCLCLCKDICALWKHS